MAKASNAETEALADALNELSEVIDGDFLPVPEEVMPVILKHRRALAAWSRTVTGYMVLRDNCCDPDCDHLEWKPEVKAAMEAYAAREAGA